MIDLEDLGLVGECSDACIVADDPGEVVTHAHPTTEADRARIREQQIARLAPDPNAVRSREARIAREKLRLAEPGRRRHDAA